MSSLQQEKEISVTDMHTGGEPLRIITAGYPQIKGDTILAKRRYVKENLDEYRTMLMFEPRGHYDQYGALLVEPDLSDADIGVLFMHNEGYSTMCGHAVIALGRYIVDKKLTKKEMNVQNGTVVTKLQCPCGLVEAHVDVIDGSPGRVTFTSVPAFIFKSNITVEIPSYGQVTLDISYGGAFYALVDVNQVGLNISTTPCTELVKFASIVTKHIQKNISVKHPIEEDLSFLYGTILTDGKDDYNANEGTKNLCVFADSQVDRSPTGSGVTARLAAHYAKGLIKLNQKRTFINSKIGSEFIGEVAIETCCGEFKAVRIKVSGEAFYTGTSKFIREERDPFKNGFLIR